MRAPSDQRVAPPAAGQPYSLFRDIAHGALLGDAGPRLRFPGALTQIVLGYVPIVGTLCALRDFVACHRSGRTLAAGLNFLALLPVFGGLPKTVEVIGNLVTTGHTGKLLIESLHADSPDTLPAALPDTLPDTLPPPQKIAPSRRHNRAALVSLLLALVLPLPTLLALDSAPSRSGAITVFAAGTLVALLTVVAGHVGLRRASWAGGARLAGCAPVVGLTLGYLYLILFSAALGAALLTR